MSESALWADVRPALYSWDPVRVETSHKDGIPDVNHINGWLELKYEKEWPTKPDTPLRVPHYRPEQRVWHTRRCLSGGRCHVLIKVQNDILLFWGINAAQYLGYLPKAELLLKVCRHWAPGQKWKKELKDELLNKW